MLSSIRFCVERITGTALMNYSLEREARMLKKMVDKKFKKSNHSKKQPFILSSYSFSAPYLNTGKKRKITALNKIYMEQVVQIFECSQTCSHLLDLGLDVTRVNLSGCHKFLDIFWVMKNDEIPEENITNLFSKAANEIKEVGSLQKTFGRIPMVRFVKDLTLQEALKAEKIFKSPEFVKLVKPTHPENVYTEFDDQPGEDLPEMRQDVLGLDRSKISDRIRADMDKEKIFAPKGQFEQSEVEPGPLVAFDKKTFKVFYKKKLQLDKKMDPTSIFHFKKGPEVQESTNENSEIDYGWEYDDKYEDYENENNDESEELVMEDDRLDDMREDDRLDDMTKNDKLIDKKS